MFIGKIWFTPFNHDLNALYFLLQSVVAIIYYNQVSSIHILLNSGSKKSDMFELLSPK